MLCHEATSHYIGDGRIHQCVETVRNFIDCAFQCGSVTSAIIPKVGIGSRTSLGSTHLNNTNVRRVAGLRRTLGLIVMLEACGTQTQTPTQIDLEDSGRICLYASDALHPLDPADAGPQMFTANKALRVQYVLPDVCLSTGCSQELDVSCSLTSSGQAFAVSSSAMWKQLTADADHPCFADCYIVNTECATSDLSAGHFTFVYGTKTVALDVPSDHPGPLCVSN